MKFKYRNVSKFSDGQVFASRKSASDQGLNCLPFCLYLMNTLLYGTLYQFLDILCSNFSGVHFFLPFL